MLDPVSTSEGVAVVHLFCARTSTTEEARWLEVYAEGLAAYRAGRWVEADAALAEALAARPEHLASQLLVERIRALRDDPPDDWRGIWTFESK